MCRYNKIDVDPKAGPSIKSNLMRRVPGASSVEKFDVITSRCCVYSVFIDPCAGQQHSATPPSSRCCASTLVSMPTCTTKQYNERKNDEWYPLYFVVVNPVFHLWEPDDVDIVKAARQVLVLLFLLGPLPARHAAIISRYGLALVDQAIAIAIFASLTVVLMFFLAVRSTYKIVPFSSQPPQRT